LSNLIIVYLVQESTYIDRDDLADFLSNIQQVADDWRRLQHVLGTKPSACSRIVNLVFSGLSSIKQAISDFLCDWNGETGLYECTVCLLCYGSDFPDGTVLTEGLKRHGFVLAAGKESNTNII
jgi:hypothetical protein